MLTVSIWLSYDLGIKGDFQGLYSWLDDHRAKECGNNVAYLNYSFTGAETDLVQSLRKDLMASVDFKPSDRVYIVHLTKVGDNHKVQGRFIIGNRRSNPWVGYGSKNEETQKIDE